MPERKTLIWEETPGKGPRWEDICPLFQSCKWRRIWSYGLDVLERAAGARRQCAMHPSGKTCLRSDRLLLPAAPIGGHQTGADEQQRCRFGHRRLRDIRYSIDIELNLRVAEVTIRIKPDGDVAAVGDVVGQRRQDGLKPVVGWPGCSHLPGLERCCHQG